MGALQCPSSRKQWGGICGLDVSLHDAACKVHVVCSLCSLLSPWSCIKYPQWHVDAWSNLSAGLRLMCYCTSPDWLSKWSACIWSDCALGCSTLVWSDSNCWYFSYIYLAKMSSDLSHYSNTRIGCILNSQCNDLHLWWSNYLKSDIFVSLNAFRETFLSKR